MERTFETSCKSLREASSCLMAKQNIRDTCSKDMLAFKYFGGPENWLMKKVAVSCCCGSHEAKDS